MKLFEYTIIHESRNIRADGMLTAENEEQAKKEAKTFVYNNILGFLTAGARLDRVKEVTAQMGEVHVYWTGSETIVKEVTEVKHIRSAWDLIKKHPG